MMPKLRTIAIIISQQGTEPPKSNISLRKLWYILSLRWSGNSVYKASRCADDNITKTSEFLQDPIHSELWLSHANLILTTQCNSLPIPLECCRAPGIQWAVSLSTVQSHYDTSSTKIEHYCYLQPHWFHAFCSPIKGSHSTAMCVLHLVHSHIYLY